MSASWPILRWPGCAACRTALPIRAARRATAICARWRADMLETMYAAPGRGLAAPQVGGLVRLFVMDATWREGRPDAAWSS